MFASKRLAPSAGLQHFQAANAMLDLGLVAQRGTRRCCSKYRGSLDAENRSIKHWFGRSVEGWKLLNVICAIVLNFQNAERDISQLRAKARYWKST